MFAASSFAEVPFASGTAAEGTVAYPEGVSATGQIASVSVFCKI